MSINEKALQYHKKNPPGKIEVLPTKPCNSQEDLSMAYTPGVAEPCREIFNNPEKSFEYTSRGNLVAVISNGSAVLGLGNIGPLAGKPVMEGKSVLFKRFSGIDVFDLEIDENDPGSLVSMIKKLEPTFGGINLEDIKAPECFYIEEKLKKVMDIPVFHDDQHGTAIISGAGLLNASKIQEKDLGKVKVVFTGAGAAAISCARHYVNLGVKKENLLLVDSRGVVYKGRKEGMSKQKEEFAVNTKRRTLKDAMEGADCFAGLSIGGLVTCEMVKSMAEKPIIFAMANPDPEIDYNSAKNERPDSIMATGRSDFPNQVNNVLGFPFIFRGALDVRATDINEEMKIAATHALADIAAKGNIPESVLNAYNLDRLDFGPEYIIPKPMDPRVLVEESIAVAKAAGESGVARKPVKDFDKYRKKLEELSHNLIDL